MQYAYTIAPDHVVLPVWRSATLFDRHLDPLRLAGAVGMGAARRDDWMYLARAHARMRAVAGPHCGTKLAPTGAYNDDAEVERGTDLYRRCTLWPNFVRPTRTRRPSSHACTHRSN